MIHEEVRLEAINESKNVLDDKPIAWAFVPGGVLHVVQQSSRGHFS